MSAADIERLLQKLAAAELDTLLVVRNANVRYLTGFIGEGAYVAVTSRGVTLFINSLYIEHARETVPSPVAVRETRDGVFETFSALGEAFWGRRIGFEGEAVSHSFLDRFRAAVSPAETVPADGIVEEFRLRKTSREVEAMVRAQRIAEGVFDEVLPLVREGVRERDLANEIDYRMRRAGGERPAFETIAASGPNSAKPHAIPGDRVIRPGDFVLFDMGTVVDGYASDMTRTVVLGETDARRREVYRIVLDAQQEALAGIRAGMTCAGADRLARGVIERAGYGDSFVHTLGHGVGLEVHEAPRLSSRSDAVLTDGMVVTVEPGIYLPGWGGVRIEDMVLVTGNGCTNLTVAPKELLEL